MINSCSESGCESPVTARGLCSLHYQRYRYRGQLDEIVPKPSKVCAHCGEPFDPKYRRWGAIYCSGRCNDAAAYSRKRQAKGRRVEHCEQCGASLAGKRSDARFCSVNCSQNWRNARTAERLRGKKALRHPCVGCGGPIAVERRGNAKYCSDECKSRSRRHEAYGLTKQALDLLLVQHERCAICGTDEWDRKGPQVDHCHDTGRVRGILCGNCNQGLGRFGDNPERLRAAADYLERSIYA